MQQKCAHAHVGAVGGTGGGGGCGGSVGDRWFEDKSAWESGSLPCHQRPLHVRVCRSKVHVCVIVNVESCFFFFLSGVVESIV